MQDEADPRYILRKDFNEGVRALRDFHLRYDILIFERHLPAAISSSTAIRTRSSSWTTSPSRASRKDSVAVGPQHARAGETAERVLQTVRHDHGGGPARWTPESLQPYIDVVLEAFGPQRVMYGSDWPVMLLAGEYARWFGTVQNAIAKLSKAEQERIMGGTAAEAYGL